MVWYGMGKGRDGMVRGEKGRGGVVWGRGGIRMEECVVCIDTGSIGRK